MDDLPLWLRLWHIPGLGPGKVGLLLEHFDSVQAIFAASAAQLCSAGISSALARRILDDQADRAALERALSWQQAPDNHILSLADPRYPPRLRQTPRPPAVLYVKGEPAILHEPQMALVGSRNPSQGGSDNAFQFAKHLSASGVLVCSGLALGIDGESHRGALAAAAPTIAVTATGLDRVYPARHKPLAEEILQHGGALVSEYPLGSSPRAEHFPQRNRIIAGLSLGTLVVEAALRSGSLITARLAREMGREVFAIPGSIHNPMSKGCHALIKQGAKLVESADDILEEIAAPLKEALADYPHSRPTSSAATPDSPTPEPANPPADAPSNDQQTLLTAMGFEVVSIDELSQRTPFSAGEIASMLLILELEGIVNSEAGGRYQRCQ